VYHCDVFSKQDTENYVKLNSTDPDFDSLFENQQFDICINASGAGNVGMSLTDPLNDFTLNTHNVIKILEAIRKFNKNCKFLNLSSAAVYGSPNKLPISEDHPLQPLSPYGFHKVFAEQLCKQYFTFYNLSTCNLRVFSAYGNGLKKQLFWDTYQKSKLPGDSIIFFGTGNETRDFIHIEDLLEAIKLVIDKCEFNGDFINVASGVETTIKDATALLLNQIPVNKEVIFNNQIKKGDPLNWRADISKLKQLGFSQKISLELGLSKYSKWLQENQL
jgi:UDP-glucose 4-epimerase